MLFRHGFLVKGIVLFFCVFLGLGQGLKGGSIAEFGRTYDIVEPDAYEEVLEAAKNANVKFERYKKALQEKIKKFFVVEEFNIPYARETMTRYYEPRYELPFDIRDERGRIIYPKGFTFNPLEYMNLYGEFIFFDARNASHLHWLKKGGYAGRIDVMLIATAGNIRDAEKFLKARVYRATKSMIERFDVKRIPCIIRQNGKYLEITEVGFKDVEKVLYK
jgi:hypothetical protein